MDKVFVIDFGSQYAHLISRRIRDLGVYSEVMPHNTVNNIILDVPDLKGLILSGGAQSVYDPASPKCYEKLLEIGFPILGICYGHQLIAQMMGGEVVSGSIGEYGLTDLKVTGKGKLLDRLEDCEKVWMNHSDVVKSLPQSYRVTASTANSEIAAFENLEDMLYGVQFHPEVTHTEKGNTILENFIFGICDAKKGWNTTCMIDQMNDEIKTVLGGRKAILGLSGGVDSATAAVLVGEMIGYDLTAVYVDTGLMRHKETELIENVFGDYDLNLRIVKAEKRFFDALRGVVDPEEKRKAIGRTFIEIFDDVAKEVDADVLVQGTIYSDRIESGLTDNSSRIKSHHNVGGLPKDMKLEVYEPLRNLYKDEVRRVAAALGIGDEITKRHVFPGPGLGVRILGEVTPEKADIVRRASYIVEDEIKSAGLYENVWMAFAVLLPIKSVGIQGDARSYKYPIVVRVIESKDAMTANFSELPYEVLKKISTRITNEVKEVNRVVYDISNKPPATMEWE